MLVAQQNKKTTRTWKAHPFINRFNSADFRSPKPKLKFLSADSDSFLVHTVTQLNIQDDKMPVFIDYQANQARRSQRLQDRRQCKKLFEQKLRQHGFIDEADKLKRCSANFTSLVCGNGHSFRPIVDYRCHLPFCPDCWELKSNRELSRILPKFRQALKDDPSLIVVFNTLTLKSDKTRNLSDGNRQLKADYKKLRRRDVYKNCVGGFGRIENTFSKKFGWHPHLHSLILVKDFISQKLLSDAWQEITTDSMIVDIRRVYDDDLRAGLIETIKYPFKPADLSRLGKYEIQQMLGAKGARLGVSFGVLFGIETDADSDDVLNDKYSEFIEETKTLQLGDPCPICQSKLDLIDFTADGYARFLGNVPIQNHVRGKPDQK
jgi:hypothetical protein